MSKIRNFKSRIRNFQQGMTYVELIVVLSIFSAITSISMFNYGDFQAKVDVKNMASDIALQIVEAQKSSSAGLWDFRATDSDWKPSYGVYFNSANNQRFDYFSDIIVDQWFIPEESVRQILITKNNSIEKLEAYYGEAPTPLNALAITFSRPDSEAKLYSSAGVELSGVSYVKITVKSPRGVTSEITVSPAGRIEVK